MSIQSFALIRCASGLSPGKPLKIGGGIFTLGGGGGAPGPGGGSTAAAACIACTNWASNAGPPPSGGGGGAPGPPPPAPAGGGGGAAILNAQLSWLLNRTLWPNTGSPCLKPIYTLSKCPGRLFTICYWWVTSDRGRLRGYLEQGTTGYGCLASLYDPPRTSGVSLITYLV